MESGIGSAQRAAASPAVSRRSPRPWRLCYTRCYMVSSHQPQTSMSKTSYYGKSPVPS